MANQIVWVDIPVNDLDRAIKFYSGILGAEIKKEDYPGMTIGLLPDTSNGVSGCLFHSEKEQPSEHGPMIYLNCDLRLDEAIATVEANGGKILKAKHPIGPYGIRAVVLDSEGNKIALHSGH